MSFEWTAGIAGAICCLICLYVFAAYLMKRTRQEIEKFKSGRQQTNDAFLQRLGLEPGTQRAEFAIALRSLIAELGRIPCEAVMPEHRIWKDFKSLPFFDSPDTLVFIVRLEQKLGISVPHEQADKIIPMDVNLTVKDMIFHLLNQPKVPTQPMDLERANEGRLPRGKDSEQGSPWFFLPVLLFVSITSLLGFMAMSEHTGLIDIISSYIILFSWPFFLLDLCLNYPIFRLKKKGKIRLIISLLIVSTVFWLCTVALLISYTFVAPDIRKHSMYVYIAIIVSIAIGIIAMKFFFRKEEGETRNEKD